MTDKHQLRTGVLGTVIGGLILTLILWLSGFLPSIWEGCKFALGWFFHFLFSSVSMPVWLIVLISFLVVPTLFRIFSSFRKEALGHPNWHDYKQDEIFGMRWRWDYGLYSGGIINISCFCPSDDTQLIYEDWGSKVAFQCETCNTRFGPFEGQINYFFGKIERQIQRKLRSGEWKAIVEQSKLQ